MSAQPSTPFLFRDVSNYIACWPGDESEIVLGFNGEHIYLPGRGRAYAENDRVKHRFLSAIDPMSNKPIPGTAVIADVWGKDQETGEDIQVLDAATLLKGMFGPQGNHKAYLLRGLRIVQSVEAIGTAMEEGRAQWEEAQIDAAINTLREEQMRVAKWEKVGVNPPPASTDVRRADEFLKRVASRRKPDLSVSDLQNTLNQVLGLAAGVIKNVPASELPPEDPQDDQRMTSEALMDAAEELKVTLTKDELRGLVRMDTETVKTVQAKILAAEEKV